MSSQRSRPDGQFLFSSLDSGEHRLCLTPTYSDNRSGKKHRVYVDLAMGASTEYLDVRVTEKVDSLTMQVHGLTQKLQEIRSEQEQIRRKEEDFRDNSESTNSKVVKWFLIQLIVLLSACAYQLRHLKSFFVKQKIV